MTRAADLDKMCPACADATLGTLLEALRNAIVAMATNLDDDSTGAADYVANCVTAFDLADDGIHDLIET